MADIGYPITLRLAYQYQGTTRVLLGNPPLFTQPSANIGHPITIHPSAPQYPLPLTQQADLGYPIRVSLLPGHRPSSVGPYYGGVICLG